MNSDRKYMFLMKSRPYNCLNLFPCLIFFLFCCASFSAWFQNRKQIWNHFYKKNCFKLIWWICFVLRFNLFNLIFFCWNFLFFRIVNYHHTLIRLITILINSISRVLKSFKIVKISTKFNSKQNKTNVFVTTSNVIKTKSIVFSLIK